MSAFARDVANCPVVSRANSIMLAVDAILVRGWTVTAHAQVPHPGRKELIAYLRASAPLLQAAIESHTEFNKHLKELYVEANAGRTANAALKARTLGKHYAVVFEQSRKRIAAVEVPSSAARTHEYLDRWLGFLVSACNVLPNAPDDGRDTSYLRDCHDYLDDARYAAKALGELRQRLHAAATGTPQKPT